MTLLTKQEIETLLGGGNVDRGDLRDRAPDLARAALAEVQGGSPLTDETAAQHEERTCTCGAGHGSLEGHTDWCDFTAYQSLNSFAEVQARDDASTPPADTTEGRT